MSKKTYKSWRLNGSGLIIAGVLAASASAAHADTTFMLQLGTSGSETEATQTWTDLKSKNADVLTGLSPHIAEVSLPPDNKITYRTQAGPIPTHEQADSACAMLKSRGANCYVIETALFTADSPAPQPASVSAPSQSVADSLQPVQIPPVSAMTPIAPSPPLPVPMTQPEIQAAAPPPPLPAPPAPPQEVMAASAPVAAGAYVPGREPKMLGTTEVSAEPAAVQVQMAQPAPVVSAPVVPVPPPQPAKAGFFTRVFGSSAAPASSGNVTANVNVAEAIRVPLSTGNPQPSKTIYTFPPVHGLGGTPSGSTHKTLWAQLSYFADETQARNFYDVFRTNYPQFSDGVRVRITRPYSSSSHAGRVSLRVGPFATTKETRTICSAAATQGLRCTVVRDLGASAAASTVRTRPVAYSNYEDRTRTTTDSPEPGYMTYWVQLGSYPSPEEAWDDWNALKDGNKKLLKKVPANVTNPAASSSLRPVFRLRAGPFLNSASADSLCNTLQATGHNCIVLSDR